MAAKDPNPGPALPAKPGKTTTTAYSANPTDMDLPELFKTDKYQQAELKAYTGIKALSAATGLDLKIIRVARDRDFPGFNSNKSVNWTHLRPAIESRHEELVSRANTDIKTLKEEIAKRDIKLKDLQIKKMESNLVEPDDVKKFVTELATKHSIVIKKELQELPPKLSGKSECEIKVLLDAAIASIFKTLQEAKTDVDKLAHESKP
jgi:hypothetical protein